MSEPTFYDPEANMVFKLLTPDEEKTYRGWARREYEIGKRIDPLWHPVVRDECKKMMAEQGETHGKTEAQGSAAG